jgi:hypothetical protein
LPGVRLIGLNSNQFNSEGKQIGAVDTEQLEWLRHVLTQYRRDRILVMIHHNVVEHLPGQAQHPLGRRYMLSNASHLLSVLQEFGVQLVFTGHLHVQDIAASTHGIYDITTGSLVSYPHPYRVLHFHTDALGRSWLQIESGRVESLFGWETLAQFSRDHLGSRSKPFMLQLLTNPPLNLPLSEAEAIAPLLQYFWADLANGDTLFDFSHLPAHICQYLESFGASNHQGCLELIDNWVTLLLEPCIRG